MDLLSPKIDYVFKKLFSASDSDDILRDFLASVLEIEPESIGEIDIQNTEIMPDAIDRKFSIMDLAMKVGERLVNVEMQVNKYNNYPERTLFYTCKRYTGDLKEGEGYGKLKPTIAINILDFNLFDSEECHSRFVMQEMNRHEILTDKLRIDFLELPKADTDKNVQLRKLKRWLNFFNMKSEEDAEMLEKTDDVIMKRAVYKLREMSADEKMREQARVREMELRDEANAIESARAEGEAHGMAQGMAQGMEQGMAQGRAQGMEQGMVQGRAQGLAGAVRALMDNMKIGAEQAMDMLGIAKEDRKKYFALLN